MKMEEPKKELVARLGGSFIGLLIAGLTIVIFYMMDSGFQASEIFLTAFSGLAIIFSQAALVFRYLDD